MEAAAGIMTAAAVWPLLVPSLDYSQSIATNRFYWLTTAVGSIVRACYPALLIIWFPTYI